MTIDIPHYKKMRFSSGLGIDVLARSKAAIVLLLVCILAACSGQGSNSTVAAELSTQSKSQTLKTETASLLASLAKEYPNGQLPADRAVLAAKALSQNPSVFKNSAAVASQAKASALNIQTQSYTSADFKPVYRIQNTTLSGSYFFTIYDFEKMAALAANPNWKLEGPAFYTLPAASTDLSPVYRFRNKLNGSYLYTAYESEKIDIQTNYGATFESEGVAWRAQQAEKVGFTPLYRFRNLVNGTYLNTAYESEKNAIVANYPTIFALEGIAYYVHQDAPPDLPLPPLSTSSYNNFKQVGLTPQSLPAGRSGVSTIRAYGNFFQYGRLDLFTATLTYWPPTTPATATPSIFEFWRKQSDGTFVKDSQMLPTPNGCIHPRKAIVADFNNDGRPDIFIACHGFDAAPFPGERNKVILSQPNGTYLMQDASPDVGFFHSASSADLNGDGLPDVIVTNNFDPSRAIVFLNQGGGIFQRESTPRLPSSIGGKNYFSAELADVNADGRMDVLLGGHEWEGATTIVLLNPGNSNFTSVTPVTIPAVANEGVVLDFTLTGSGSNRALWVLRTSGGDGTFYQSRTIQKVQWPSLTSTIPLLDRPAQWFQWIISTTINGLSVISSEDASVNVSLPQ